jgi:hypothetical protein
MSHRDLAATNSFLAFSLLYNTPIWVSACDQSRVFSALEAISDLGKDAEFLPPWEAQNVLHVEPGDCSASLYRTDDRCLLALANFADHEASSEIVFDVKGATYATACDALAEEEFTTEGDVLNVSVPRNSFRMVLMKR